MSTGAAIALLALLLALALDRWFGEPAARWHPVVWMGRYLAWAGRAVAPASEAALPAPARSFTLGALGWWAGALAVVALAIVLEQGVAQLPPWAAVLVTGLLLKPLFAWRALREETAAVDAALAESLQAGRERLARIVSRDVHRLDAPQVRESAIESLAENLNDSLVAPVFWFALAGLPGAALYRFANTADAMWGYRGTRGGRVWEWAGKWAARADDVLSWLPARLTALFIALASPRLAWRQLPAQARCTPSPNGGWPMAAMALALGVRLGKPGVYLLNPLGREVLPGDGPRARGLAGRTLPMLVVVAGLLLAGREGVA